jgi:hypothetical protein
MPTAATNKKMWFCPEIEQLVKEGAAGIADAKSKKTRTKRTAKLQEDVEEMLATMKLKSPADLATVRSHSCSALCMLK